MSIYHQLTHEYETIYLSSIYKLQDISTLIDSIEMVKFNNPHYYKDIIPFYSEITIDIYKSLDDIQICMRQNGIIFEININRWYIGVVNSHQRTMVHYTFLDILVGGLKLANRLIL